MPQCKIAHIIGALDSGTDAGAGTVFYKDVYDVLSVDRHTLSRASGIEFFVKSATISLLSDNPLLYSAANRQNRAIFWQVSGLTTNPYRFMMSGLPLSGLWIEGVTGTGNIITVSLLF